jgi:SP family arabinose:H+ symporter-like MFS transporter
MKPAVAGAPRTRTEPSPTGGPRPGRPQGYIYLIASVAAISGLLFGFDTAVINGALVLLKEEFHLSDFQTELAAGALLWGCVFGAAVSGFLTDRFGRRRLLMHSALLFCAAALGSAMPRELWELAAARFAGGVAIGIASVLAPMYIAEVSPSRSRGRLVSLNQLAIVTGILCAYFVNWWLAQLGGSGWRWMFAVAAVPSLLFFAGLFWIPESPRWLVGRGRSDEALATLSRIDDRDAAQVEFAAIRISIAEESAASMADLWKPGLRRALLIAVTLAILQQVTGINTVLYYGAIMFKEHGGQAASSAIGANVAVGMVNFLCTIMALSVIDKAGRKPLLMLGSAGMGVALLCLGLAFRIKPAPAVLILSMVLAYVACFAVSLGPGVWVYIAEIFPTAVRGRAMSVATVCLWSACLLVTMTFLSLVSFLSPAGAFWTYAVLCGVTFVFVWRVIPETKGKTLEEIQRIWRRS